MIVNKDFITRNASRTWAFFLDLIFPIECLGCGREGRWLCEDCFKKINLKPKQYCLHCKKANDFGQFCLPCQVIYSLDGVWIAALYDELLISQAIKKLKYYFLSGLADDLSRLMILSVDKLLEQGRISKFGLRSGVDWSNFKRAAGLPLAVLNFYDNLVVPVPLSRKRLRWRGFNQAELLARRVAEKYGLELNSGNLIRVKHKKAQAKLNEIHRLENIKNCFVWRGGNLNKKNIILVDDVVTTGATLNECAKILKANGAGEVFGLVVAKG
ncbi:MAG: Competence protein F [Parcubacteria group bacterium GW2011_GWC2_42_12]|nr:MAG: Competence protein F [Parcubacteria group bacterium GW2011_GWC2_42_12]